MSKQLLAEEDVGNNGAKKKKNKTLHLIIEYLDALLTTLGINMYPSCWSLVCEFLSCEFNTACSALTIFTGKGDAIWSNNHWLQI